MDLARSSLSKLTRNILQAMLLIRGDGGGGWRTRVRDARQDTVRRHFVDVILQASCFHAIYASVTVAKSWSPGSNLSGLPQPWRLCAALMHLALRGCFAPRTVCDTHCPVPPRRVAESILEALEEMKPTSVVGVELQDVDLGSSSPQILGVKVRRMPLHTQRSCPCLSRKNMYAVSYDSMVLPRRRSRHPYIDRWCTK